MIKRLTLALVAASYAASGAVYPKVPDAFLRTDPHQALHLARPLVTFLLPTAAALTCWVLSVLVRREH